LTLDIQEPATRFIKRLPKKQAGQIGRKLQALLTQPYPPDRKDLSGFPLALLRANVGEYRIIYQMYGDTLVVVLIGKRNDSDVYRRLARMFR